MFPGYPEHCHVEEALSEHSRNIACRLGCLIHFDNVNNCLPFAYIFESILCF